MGFNSQKEISKMKKRRKKNSAPINQHARKCMKKTLNHKKKKPKLSNSIKDSKNRKNIFPNYV